MKKKKVSNKKVESSDTNHEGPYTLTSILYLFSWFVSNTK